MKLIVKFDKGFQFLLYDTDIYSKYYWIVPLKDKKNITITNDFQKNLNEPSHKSNKIRLDKDSEFYNRSVKSWLQDADIEMYSAYNEGKPVVAERFIWALKNKI